MTGGTSLLARRCAEALLQRGDEVVVLQRHASPLDTNQVLGDVRDAEVVARAAYGCDAIVHAAAKVGVVGDFEEYRSVNVDGTANVIAAARRLGVGRLVHVSTPSVAHAGHSLVGVGAEAPVVGRTNAWYAESKAMAERLAIGAASDSLAVVAIRPHLVWGPGDAQLVGRIVQRARAGRLALIGSGDLARAQVWARQVATQAERSTGSNRAVALDVGAPLMRGILAFGLGRFDDAIEALYPVRALVVRFGGSHAQRDLIDQTLIAAASRATDKSVGRALLNERRLAKPRTPLTAHWESRSARSR